MIEIVIKIPEEDYNRIQDGLTCYYPLRKNDINKKVGHWEYREELFDDEENPRMVYGCSECGFNCKSIHDKRNYCPNCGIKLAKEYKNETNN